MSPRRRVYTLAAALVFGLLSLSVYIPASAQSRPFVCLPLLLRDTPSGAWAAAPFMCVPQAAFDAVFTCDRALAPGVTCSVRRSLLTDSAGGATKMQAFAVTDAGGAMVDVALVVVSSPPQAPTDLRVR